VSDAFWEFERAGWERAAPRYEECWTDTGLFVEPLLDAAEVHAGCRTAAVLREQPPERLDVIRTAMADGVRRYAHGEEFALPIAARVASARSGDELSAAVRSSESRAESW
jgi:hypothetical protein